jgi:hypothetical protein
MEHEMQKDIFVVTITRGRKTKFYYGEKLKEALAVAAPRVGESFKYAKFRRDRVVDARWVRDGVYAA